MNETRFHVGQEVWRHDVNENHRGGPQRVTVTKVGRALVTIEQHGRPETFRIDTGRTNDKYENGWLCTTEQHADHTARTEALGRLAALHLRFEMGGYDRHYSTDTLNAVADLLDATTRSGPDAGATQKGDNRG